MCKLSSSAVVQRWYTWSFESAALRVCQTADQFKAIACLCSAESRRIGSCCRRCTLILELSDLAPHSGCSSISCLSNRSQDPARPQDHLCCPTLAGLGCSVQGTQHLLRACRRCYLCNEYGMCVRQWLCGSFGFTSVRVIRAGLHFFPICDRSTARLPTLSWLQTAKTWHVPWSTLPENVSSLLAKLESKPDSEAGPFIIVWQPGVGSSSPSTLSEGWAYGLDPRLRQAKHDDTAFLLCFAFVYSSVASGSSVPKMEPEPRQGCSESCDWHPTDPLWNCLGCECTGDDMKPYTPRIFPWAYPAMKWSQDQMWSKLTSMQTNFWQIGCTYVNKNLRPSFLVAFKLVGGKLEQQWNVRVLTAPFHCHAGDKRLGEVIVRLGGQNKTRGQCWCSWACELRVWVVSLIRPFSLIQICPRPRSSLTSDVPEFSWDFWLLPNVTARSVEDEMLN